MAAPSAGAPVPSAPHVARLSADPSPQASAASQNAARIATQIRQGATRGSSGFLRPLRRVGGIVWLEVTGFFFLLFSTVFALQLWRNWTSMVPVSRYVSIAAGIVFLYLGLSAFWRARRR